MTEAVCVILGHAVAGSWDSLVAIHGRLPARTRRRTTTKHVTSQLGLASAADNCRHIVD